MLTSATLGMFLVELVKKLVRLVLKDPNYDFHPKLIAVLLVVANAAAVLLMAVLGYEGYTLPTDWMAWARELGRAVLAAAVSALVYNYGYKPFKQYSYKYFA